MNKQAPVTNIQKFRQTMNKLIEQLKQWSTHDQVKEVAKFEMKISTGMKIDPRGSINLFVDSILPYAHEILMGNDEYFLTTDIGTGSEYAKLTQQLKAWWPDFSEEQKEHVRRKIKLLVMLGAIAIKHEELRLIINQYREVDNPIIF